MKDFSQTKATLTILEGVQEWLNDRHERAVERLEREEENMSEYTTEKDEDGNKVYLHNGEQVDKWSFTYAVQALQDARREVQAINEVMEHMDKFKL